MSKHQGFSAVVIIVILAVLAFGGYAVWKKQPPPPTPTPPVDTNIEPATSPSTPSVDMASWKTYRNEEYGFEFKYPPNFRTHSYDPSTEKVLFSISQDLIVGLDKGQPINRITVLKNWQGNPLGNATKFAGQNVFDSGYSIDKYGGNARTIIFDELPGNFFISMISESAYTPEIILVNRSALDQILSTFRFTK